MEKQVVVGETGLSSKRLVTIGGISGVALLFVALYNKQSSNLHSTEFKVVEHNGNDIEVDASSGATTTTASSTPNIFLFTVDDMGWNDIGYNSGDLPEATPYMRGLAKKGITLTHYYTQPSCTPSRVTMMTGKFAFKNGFQNYELQHSDYTGVPLSNKMTPAYMRDLGYTTVGFGKWNIGHCNSKYLPSARGFDHFLGYLCPGHGYTNHDCGNSAEFRDLIEDWYIDGKHTWSNGADYLGTYDTLLYREETQKAVRKHFSDDDASPLFMWLAHHGMHSEWDSDPIPPDELLTSDNKDYLKVLKKRLDEVGSEEDGYTQFFKMRMITAAVLMSLDNALKNLVQTLEEVGEISNSVIFMNSDNGGDTVYTKGHPGNNYPLRSEKFSYYEGGIRVPAFVFAPGIIATEKQGTMYHGLMHHVDLMATFIHLGGGDTSVLSSDSDSVNQWYAIMGDTTSPRSEIVFNLPRSREWKLGESNTEEGVALRMGNYKLLLNHAQDLWFSDSPGVDFHGASDMKAAFCQYSFYSLSKVGTCVFENYLFNLLDDPKEKNNLWHHPDHDAIKQNMLVRAEELVAEVTTDYGKLLPAFYEKGHLASATIYEDAFTEFGSYVGPFGCDTIA